MAFKVAVNLEKHFSICFFKAHDLWVLFEMDN